MRYANQFVCWCDVVLNDRAIGRLGLEVELAWHENEVALAAADHDMRSSMFNGII